MQAYTYIGVIKKIAELNKKIKLLGHSESDEDKSKLSDTSNSLTSLKQQIEELEAEKKRISDLALKCILPTLKNLNFDLPEQNVKPDLDTPLQQAEKAYTEVSTHYFLAVKLKQRPAIISQLKLDMASAEKKRDEAKDAKNAEDAKARKTEGNVSETRPDRDLVFAAAEYTHKKKDYNNIDDEECKALAVYITLSESYACSIKNLVFKSVPPCEEASIKMLCESLRNHTGFIVECPQGNTPVNTIIMQLSKRQELLQLEQARTRTEVDRVSRKNEKAHFLKRVIQCPEITPRYNELHIGQDFFNLCSSTKIIKDTSMYNALKDLLSIGHITTIVLYDGSNSYIDRECLDTMISGNPNVTIYDKPRFSVTEDPLDLAINSYVASKPNLTPTSDTPPPSSKNINITLPPLADPAVTQKSTLCEEINAIISQYKKQRSQSFFPRARAVRSEQLKSLASLADPNFHDDDTRIKELKSMIAAIKEEINIFKRSTLQALIENVVGNYEKKNVSQESSYSF